jgi:hypothetical protein
MNIIKRLLNVAFVLAVLITIYGVFNAPRLREFVAGFCFMFGIILILNYVFFQKVTIWHKLEKPRD